MHLHNDHCLYAELLPSGEVILRCEHTNCQILHLGKQALYIEKLVHDPKNKALSCVCLKATLKVPLRCDSGDRLELVGGWVKADGCSCHHEHPELELTSSEEVE